MELVDRENGVIRGILTTKEDERVGAVEKESAPDSCTGNVVNPSAIV